MGIHEGQCFWNVSFCQVLRRIGEELRLELQTFISISLPKVRLMVCLDVLNRLKIRMKNMDSEVFLFSSSKEIKTDRKKIYCSPYTSRKCWRWTLRSYLLLLISFFPWFFSCCCRFFSSLPIFSIFLFSFFFFFLSFFLWILVYFSTDRFSVWVFKPFF